MKYFTRGWANGELTDEEDTRMREAYASRMAGVATRLPEAMIRLRDGVSLHDAVIENVSWNPSSRELRMTLIAGASEADYQTVCLLYRGAMLGARRLASLRRVAEHREACVLHQELDVEDDGTLVHRLLFWPNEEVTVDFRKLVYAATPRADRRATLGGAFVGEEGTEPEHSDVHGPRPHVHATPVPERPSREGTAVTASLVRPLADALFQVEGQEPVSLAHLERVNPSMTREDREAIVALRVGKTTTLTRDGTTVRLRRTC